MTDAGLSGQTFLVTGSNTGIGRVTAETLAKRGAKVLLACRSEEKTRPVVDGINAGRAAGGGEAEFVALDLADLVSVRKCAEALLTKDVPLHGLINNAGLAGLRGVTKQGFELTFGTNHLGHFLLTQLLLPRLRQSAAAAAPAAFRLPWRSALACVTARTAQLVQYGVLLSAVGGTVSVRGAFIAHGIHLVGATIGDAVPNQLGVVDGTYRAFAAALGFADAPARALSIAFVAHAVQMTVAGLCVIVAAVTRRARAAIVHGAGSPLGVTAK